MLPRGPGGAHPSRRLAGLRVLPVAMMNPAVLGEVSALVMGRMGVHYRGCDVGRLSRDDEAAGPGCAATLDPGWGVE